MRVNLFAVSSVERAEREWDETTLRIGDKAISPFDGDCTVNTGVTVLSAVDVDVSSPVTLVDTISAVKTPSGVVGKEPRMEARLRRLTVNAVSVVTPVLNTGVTTLTAVEFDASSTVTVEVSWMVSLVTPIPSIADFILASCLVGWHKYISAAL